MSKESAKPIDVYVLHGYTGTGKSAMFYVNPRGELIIHYNTSKVEKRYNKELYTQDDISKIRRMLLTEGNYIESSSLIKMDPETGKAVL